MHLKNIERSLKYTLKETSANNVIDVLHEKTKTLIEKHITQRDVENFVAYLKFLTEKKNEKKGIKVEHDTVQDFVDRVYSECDHKTRYARGKNLNIYFETHLGKNAALNKKELNIIYKKLKDDRESMDKVMMRVCVALILKWSQGPIRERLSEDLNKHIAFMATVYGMYGTDRVFNVEWKPYKLCKEDKEIIRHEFEFFEKALTQAIKHIHDAIETAAFTKKYKDHFHIVLENINDLINMSGRGKLASIDAFTAKIIIAATLVYLQDESVAKDPNLEELIKLFVSFYYQFRDKRYIPVFTDISSLNSFA